MPRTSVPTPAQLRIHAAREQRLRSLEREQRHDEVVRAKWVQKQTGCTWTEALRASKAN